MTAWALAKVALCFTSKNQNQKKVQIKETDLCKRNLLYPTFSQAETKIQLAYKEEMLGFFFFAHIYSRSSITEEHYCLRPIVSLKLLQLVYHKSMCSHTVCPGSNSHLLDMMPKMSLLTLCPTFLGKHTRYTSKVKINL